MAEKSDNSISTRVPVQTREALERLAAADRRTLSNYVRLVLERYVNEVKAAAARKKASKAA